MSKFALYDYVRSVRDIEAVPAGTLGIVMGSNEQGYHVMFEGSIGLLCQDDDLRGATVTKVEVVNTPNPAESYLSPTEFD